MSFMSQSEESLPRLGTKYHGRSDGILLLRQPVRKTVSQNLRDILAEDSLMRSMFVDSPYRHASTTHPFVAAPMRNQPQPSRPISLKRNSRPPPQLIEDGAAIMPIDKRRSGPAKERPARLQPLFIGQTHSSIDWPSIDTRRSRLSFNPLTRESKIVPLPSTKPKRRCQSVQPLPKAPSKRSPRPNSALPTSTPCKKSPKPKPQPILEDTPQPNPSLASQQPLPEKPNATCQSEATSPQSKLDVPSHWDAATPTPSTEPSPTASNAPTLLDSESNDRQLASWRHSMHSIAHLFKKSKRFSWSPLPNQPNAAGTGSSDS
ncbi:hypothetical protein DSO57_1021757 [Entomophthora muscae]|uniref:Uncharacterized protein n=1 Tax=Entomophthora muscae TaxID=34485 RepID=A0ACC2RUE1_9FUNG|nr:hypothetical protein DSO57_1021757 [Entomophthora muscae]